ncbi:probable 28S rRNA (cytosine-C(5))-methyltransferase [Nasonia vitripennis]|uniref:SAM-dependent MTase RsmB/NOP-type domain-containing protein n=1 Tax=Nasonia vitripennis TaxID=7425 RepID=A0A7M7IX30_NASVI|nr:probable 28S rRNA (cytosine-C(5))-methyltransferase [Nasonia vitripennis]XP_016844881.1 probable 28S rRNA (cytosine-C(5))-methyltransferase [Nasonia vitripennis]
MNCNMSTTFVHSVKVPRIYKECASTVKKVLADGASFKTLVFKQNHPNVQGIYALVSETLHHCKELQSIIDQTEILIENPRFDPWLARVLITELLWGKKVLKSEAKPILTVLNYKEKLQQALVQNPDAAVDPCDKKKVKLPRYVRVNTLLTSIDEALSAFAEDGWRLLPRCYSYTSHLKTISNMGYDNFIQDFHIPEVLIFPPGTKFHDHPGYLSGKLLLQDKASCLPAFLLNPKPNSEVMDMCSAPGMKTTHLAAVINNEGKIYAIEMKDTRYRTLCDFVTNANASCVETIQADALTISPEFYPNIEYILVDPSCSGSGMVDRIEIRKEDQNNLYNRLGKLQSLQSMILNHALKFPNAKRVVYSTCSIYPEENECVVDEAMTKFGDIYNLVDLKRKLKNEWISFGSAEYSYYGDKCLYARPEVDHCSGFFLAVFQRKPKSSESEEGLNAKEENATLEQAYDNHAKNPSNGYHEQEVQNIKSEEIATVQDDQSKKKKKKRKIDLEGIEDPSNECQPQHETIVISEEDMKVEEVKPKKKKKERKIDSVMLEDHEHQSQHEVTVESKENTKLEKVESKKKKKKKEKNIDDTEEIQDSTYKHRPQHEMIIDSKASLDEQEVESKKKKKKKDKTTNLQTIENTSYEHETIVKSEENLQAQEDEPKKKKKKDKEIDSEEKVLQHDNQSLHEIIDGSNEAKSKRKKHKTKETDQTIEVNEPFDETSVKEKKKKKKDKREVETEKQ